MRRPRLYYAEQRNTRSNTLLQTTVRQSGGHQEHETTTNLFFLYSCLVQVVAPTCICQGRAYCHLPTPRRRCRHWRYYASQTKMVQTSEIQRNQTKQGATQTQNNNIQIRPTKSRWRSCNVARAVPSVHDGGPHVCNKFENIVQMLAATESAQTYVMTSRAYRVEHASLPQTPV
jgi:hypothetical protein